MSKQGEYIKKKLKVINPEFPSIRLKFGNFKSGRRSHWHRYRRARVHGNTIICCEPPVIGRAQFNKCWKTKADTYIRIAVSNSSTLDRGGFIIPDRVTDHRLKMILRDTGMDVVDKKPGSTVLYLMQTARDTSLQGRDMEQVAIYDLHAILEHTDRKIIVSSHPTQRARHERLRLFCDEMGIRWYNKGTWRLYRDAWCTISHCSGCAVEAMMAGVPAITLSPASFASGCSKKLIRDIENVTLDGRWEWLSRLAYTQWKISELKHAIQRLEPLWRKNSRKM